MKITIEIPDALAQEANRVARRDGDTLRQLIVAGLRTELARRAPRPPDDFVFPTIVGEGLLGDLPPEEAIIRAYG